MHTHNDPWLTFIVKTYTLTLQPDVLALVLCHLAPSIQHMVPGRFQTQLKFEFLIARENLNERSVSLGGWMLGWIKLF